jgi:hypothetical protein
MARCRPHSRRPSGSDGSSCQLYDGYELGWIAEGTHVRRALRYLGAATRPREPSCLEEKNHWSKSQSSG